MEHTGKIFKAGIEKAKSGNDVFKVGLRTADGDHDYTLFDPTLISAAKNALETNQSVKVIVSQSGKFWNVDSIEVTEEPQGKSEPRRWGRSAEEVASIEAQVAAKILSDLLVAGKIGDGSFEAKILFDWCFRKMGVDPNIPGRAEQPKVSQPLSTKKELWAEIDRMRQELQWTDDYAHKFVTETFQGKELSVLNATELQALLYLLKAKAKSGKQGN